jgi:GlpG protein
MSGPDFLGISGVICGMLGFIWARQHRAAWEGYNLVPGVISFMLFFILAIMGIQMISFFLQIYKNINFMPGIANTAHITGGLVGYLLGCLNIFGLKKYS